MAGPGPEYETPELCTRVFPVGAVGALWRERLPAADLSLAQRNVVEAEAAVAAELGCPLDTAAELRAVCRYPGGGRQQPGLRWGGEEGRVHECMNSGICVGACLSVRMRAYVRMHASACVCACAYVYVHAHVHVCAHLCVHMYIRVCSVHVHLCM